MEQSNNTDTGDTNSAQAAVPVSSPRIPLVRNIVCSTQIVYTQKPNRTEISVNQMLKQQKCLRRTHQ